MRPDFVQVSLDLLCGWVNELAGDLPEPVKVPLPGGDFQWRHEDEDARVLLVCKSVRIATAISGAWTLANAGVPLEAGTLTRLVGDFSAEIRFVAESIVEGRETRAQREFREHFFEPLPRSMSDFLERERRRYVSRGEIAKADRRLSEKAGVDADLQADTSAFIAFGLDKYVHGAYETAMELYHGGHRRFMLEPGSSPPPDAIRRFVGSKTTEALQAVAMAAMALGRPDIAEAIGRHLDEVDTNVSRTGGGTRCDQTPDN